MKKRVKVSMSGQMEKYMMVNGFLGSNTGMLFLLILKEKVDKEDGKMGKE